MKSIWREIILAVIMGMILPGITLNWAVEREEPTAPTVRQPEQVPEVVKPTLEMYLRKRDGTLQTMDMDTYLVGVILAEMPGSFETEAKKAQAVVARTYARKAWVTGGKHGDGSVCQDSACCQAYISVEEYLAQLGSETAVEEARNAVSETSDQVLTYEGQLIEATYFSCSGGSTEDAAAVWGTDFPYLRAVDSPGEEYALHHTDRVYFTKGDFTAALGLKLTGDPADWIGTATHTPGGGVDTIEIGGKSFSGKELRSLLGLRSTAFSMAPDAWGVSITTKGFGHRVGMSQYGADAMAMAGSTYEEILAHYYRGAILELTNVTP